MGFRKAFTLSEKRKIEELLKTEMSLTSIAKEIGRSKNGVVSEVRLNGGRENYRAEASEHRVLDIAEDVKKKARDYMLNKPKSPKSYRRFEVIEDLLKHFMEKLALLENRVEYMENNKKECGK